MRCGGLNAAVRVERYLRGPEACLKGRFKKAFVIRLLNCCAVRHHFSPLGNEVISDAKYPHDAIADLGWRLREPTTAAA
jgi:hypothetical protein